MKVSVVFKNIGRVCRAVLITLACLLVLLWAVLQFWGFEKITSYKPQLEAQISQVLNSRVTIDHLSLAWDWGRLRADVRGLNIYRKGENAAAVSAQDAYVIVSWRSLWAGMPILAHAQLNRPYIEIVRNAEGQLYFADYMIDMTKKGDGSGARIFFSQPSIAIAQARVLWRDHTSNGRAIILDETNVEISNGQLSHRFDIQARLNIESEKTDKSANQEASVLSLKIQADMAHEVFAVDFADTSKWRGVIRAQLPQLDLARVYDVSGALAGYLPEVIQEARTQIKPLSGMLDLDVMTRIDQLQVHEITGAFHLAQLNLPLPQNSALVPSQSYQLKAIKTQFSYQSQAPKLFELRLKNINIEALKGVTFSPSPIRIVRDTPSRVKITMDDMAFSPLLVLAQNLPLIARYSNPLLALSIDGQVKGLALEFDGAQFKIAAQLKDLNAHSREGKGEGGSITPLVKGFNATIAGDDQQGQLSANAQMFGALLPDIMDKNASVIENLALNLDWTHAVTAAEIKKAGYQKVAYQQGLNQKAVNQQVLNTDKGSSLPESNSNHHWKFNITQLDFDQAALKWRSQGVYQLNTEPGAKSDAKNDHLQLNAKINQLELSSLHRYIPYSIAGARTWLSAAFSRGTLRDLNLALNTSLTHFELPTESLNEEGKNAKMPVSTPPVLKLTGKITAAQVNYLPGAKVQHKGATLWPTLQVAQADVLMENRHLTITSQQAETSGIAVHDLNFQIPDLTAPVILVDAKGTGPLAGLIDYVNKSPVGALIGNVTADMMVSGDSGLDLLLKLPLVGKDPLTLSGRVPFKGNHVLMTAKAPKISNITGDVTFNHKGANTDELYFDLLGGRHHYRIKTDDKGAMRVDGQGALKMAALQAYAPTQAIWRGISGELPYQLEATIADGAINAQIDSSAQGLDLKLPLPFRKAASERKPLSISLHKGQKLALDAKWFGAEGISVHAKADQLAPNKALGNGLSADIFLSRFDLNEWLPFLTPEKPIESQADAVSGTFDAALLIPSAQLPVADVTLKIGAARASYIDLGEVVLGLNNDIPKAAWNFSLNSKVAQAKGAWFAAPQLANSCVQGQFAFIRIPAPPSNPTAAAPAAENAVPTAKVGVEVKPAPPPTAIPRVHRPMFALPKMDIKVDDLVLLDRPLGALSLEGGDSRAQPSDQDVAWQLTKAELKNPAINLHITGAWNERNTRFAPEILIHNAGMFLDILHLKNILADGAGTVDGQVSWLGNPLDFEMARLDGDAQVQLNNGSITVVNIPAWRYLSFLSLQSYANLKDAFSKYPSYDKIDAAVIIQKGQLQTQHATVESVFANANAKAQVDLVAQNVDARIVLQPKVDLGAGVILYGLLINPVVAVPLFLSQWLGSSYLESWIPVLHIYGPFKNVKFETLKQK